jgi:hypothetical protein
MVWLTAIVAFATLCLAVAALFQYLTARQQSKAAIEQAGTVKEQANVMQRQLNTMQDQANSAREQTNTLGQSLGETRKSVNAAERQASASMVQANTARQAVEVSTRSLQMEQRPIVVVSFINLKDDVKAGEKTSATVAIVNTGRTPAVKAQIVHHIGFALGQEPPPVSGPEPPEEPSVAVLAPNVVFPNDVMTEHAITDQEFNGLTIAKYRVFVWGQITYDDLFGNHYRTEFCALIPGLKKHLFAVCPRHDTFK